MEYSTSIDNFTLGSETQTVNNMEGGNMFSFLFPSNDPISSMVIHFFTLRFQIVLPLGI
jgi:hypothetical protein